MPVPVLKLKRGEDRRLRAGHLWIFSNEVDTAATPLTQFEPGAAVQVHSDRDQFLGFAYVNPRTLIAARIVGRDADYPLDGSLLVHRLRVALALRERLYREPFYRLVYGESDGLPGLVLDRYGDVVVAQSGTAGIDRLQAEVEAAVAKVVGVKTLVWKNDSSARDLEGLAKVIGVRGNNEWITAPAEVTVREQGLDFIAPLAEGQKTGWFYDQAANRERLRRYLGAGTRVLDVCSYVGAWAVCAMRAGAGSATCVDSSASALQFVERNARANGVAVTRCATMPSTHSRHCRIRARDTTWSSSIHRRSPSARRMRRRRRPRTASSTSWHCR
jgi:23S rRNA (cytosine1962-C5)-methyltransferase